MTAMIVSAGGLLNAIGFAQIAGDNPAARAVFAQQMELLARQLTYLLPAPAQLDTMAGYLTWRWFGSAVLMGDSSSGRPQYRRFVAPPEPTTH